MVGGNARNVGQPFYDRSDDCTPFNAACHALTRMLAAPHVQRSWNVDAFSRGEPTLTEPSMAYVIL
jgi:hypothetical protein